MEDYKQKYEQAMLRMNKWVEGSEITDPKEVAEFVFPELRKSDDERIRKELIRAFTVTTDKRSHEIYGNGITYGQVLAWLEKQGHDGKKWIYEDAYIKEKEQVFQDGIDEVLENPQRYGLEKQGEQKPFDYENANIQQKDFAPKGKPKFKVGDWITNGIDFTFQVISIEDNHYLRSDDYFIDIETADKKFRLWTIQDAKDGDVLALNGEVFIYAHRKQLYSIAIAHCFVDSAGGFYFDGEFGYTEKRNSIHPATKEQRNLLFQKMKEAGYEWDAEKKELKKIEQNSSWSEEDEEMLEGLNNCLTELEEKNGWRYVYINNKDVELCEVRSFLKSLKERYTWKPSDELKQLKKLRAE